MIRRGDERGDHQPRVNLGLQRVVVERDARQTYIDSLSEYIQGEHLTPRHAGARKDQVIAVRPVLIPIRYDERPASRSRAYLPAIGTCRRFYIST